jgi:hypothetical protein
MQPLELTTFKFYVTNLRPCYLLEYSVFEGIQNDDGLQLLD